MAVTKKIQIQNAAGTGYDSRDIGAEAQYVVVSRDVSGDIIEDITAAGVVIDSTEELSETLKNLEENKEDTLTFDTTPTENSTNPVTSGGVYSAIQPDNALSTSSTNSVQNKVVTAAINKRQATYVEAPSDWDTVPTQNSTKPITSGGIYNTLAPLTAVLAAGDTSVTITSARIKTTSVLLPVSETFGLAPNSMTVTNGQVVMTYDEQEQTENVGVLVY